MDFVLHRKTMGQGDYESLICWKNSGVPRSEVDMLLIWKWEGVLQSGNSMCRSPQAVSLEGTLKRYCESVESIPIANTRDQALRAVGNHWRIVSRKDIWSNFCLEKNIRLPAGSMHWPIEQLGVLLEFLTVQVAHDFACVSQVTQRWGKVNWLNLLLKDSTAQDLVIGHEGTGFRGSRMIDCFIMEVLKTKFYILTCHSYGKPYAFGHCPLKVFKVRAY